MLVVISCFCYLLFFGELFSFVIAFFDAVSFESPTVFQFFGCAVVLLSDLIVQDGHNALFLAAQGGDVKTVKLVLSAGAQVNNKIKVKYTSHQPHQSLIHSCRIYLFIYLFIHSPTQPPNACVAHLCIWLLNLICVFYTLELLLSMLCCCCYYSGIIPLC